MTDILELSKPRITLMAALCSAAGCALAPGHAGFGYLLGALSLGLIFLLACLRAGFIFLSLILPVF